MDIDKLYLQLLQMGRPLDAIRVLYQKRQVSTDVLFSVLSAFQNKDGGFGHGMEPDCTNPESSPISSWSATEVLFETNLHRKHLPLTNQLEFYLAKIFDETDGKFWLTQPSNNEYPCAPWWKHQNPPWVSEFNPSAALTGFLYVRTKDQKYSEWIDRLMQSYMKTENLEMHDLVCVVRLYEYLQSDDDERSTDGSFVDKLLRDVEAACHEFDQDDTYRATPSQFFKRFSHPLAKKCTDLLDRQANLFRRQLQQGQWIDITWSWGEDSPAFSKARWAWQSQLTFTALEWISKQEGDTYD